MSVHANLVTPRNGEIVVAATQDFITGAYLMSKQGLFMTRDQFARITSYMADAAEQVRIRPLAPLGLLCDSWLHIESSACRACRAGYIWSKCSRY